MAGQYFACSGVSCNTALTIPSRTSVKMLTSVWLNLGRETSCANVSEEPATKRTANKPMTSLNIGISRKVLTADALINAATIDCKDVCQKRKRLSYCCEARFGGRRLKDRGDWSRSAVQVFCSSNVTDR